MTKDDSIFNWTARVYYEDTDAGGVVFHANYLKFFERARTEWLRSGGFDHARLAKEHGIVFVVMRAAVDYHAPARLDDELSLSMSVQTLGGASITVMQRAWRQSVGDATAQPERILVASAEIRVVCVNLSTFKAQPIPEELKCFVRLRDAEP